MAIALRSLQYVQAASVGGAGVPRPTGLAVGDLMLLFANYYNTSAGALSGPADFTQICTGAVAGYYHFWCGYKVAVLADLTTAAWAVSAALATYSLNAVLAAFSGVVAASPVVGGGYAGSSTAGTNDTFTPGLSTVTADDLLVFFADHHFQRAANFSGWQTATQNPASWTEDLDHADASTTLGFAHGQASGVGATGAWTVTTADSDKWAIGAVILSGAAAPGGGGTVPLMAEHYSRLRKG